MGTNQHSGHIVYDHHQRTDYNVWEASYHHRYDIPPMNSCCKMNGKIKSAHLNSTIIPASMKMLKKIQ